MSAGLAPMSGCVVETEVAVDVPFVRVVRVVPRGVMLTRLEVRIMPIASLAWAMTCGLVVSTPADLVADRSVANFKGWDFPLAKRRASACGS